VDEEKLFEARNESVLGGYFEGWGQGAEEYPHRQLTS